MDKIDLTIESGELTTKSKSDAIEIVVNLLSMARKLLPKINVYYCKLVEVCVNTKTNIVKTSIL
jgi:hypothetical protein